MTADTVGGVWNYSLGLAAALRTHGVHVDLATMGPLPSESQRREASSLTNVTLHESSYRLEWMEEPWNDVADAGNWLLDLERELKPEIVHLNGYAHGALPWSAPVCLVGHSCVLSWWEAVHRESAPDKWHEYRTAVTEGIRAADQVIAPSFTMLEALRRWYGPLPRSSVIHNGIPANQFYSASKLPIVFAAGRLWDKAKNLDLLIRSAPELPWPIAIAGDGNTNLPLPGNVSLLGKLSAQKLVNYFAVASIYCLPARYEPFGLSVLEAALSGCALVLGDVDSLRELWSNAALFVPPDDPAALTRTLQELMEQAGARQKFAWLAKERANHFSAQGMAASYLQIYERLSGALGMTNKENQVFQS
jgi:glycogen synthase